MKILVGIADYNPGVKDYALPKLYENLEACVQPHADILFVSDRTHPFPTRIEYQPQSFMSEDILYETRDFIRSWAATKNYDAFVWQGSDCYYDSEDDFVDLVVSAFKYDYLAVGGLTSARTDSNFPVARRFTGFNHEQKNVPNEELLSGEVVSCYGFPGADALVVRGDLIKESWKQFKGFRPWYELREEDPHSLCIEEFWILKMGLKHGDVFGLNTKVRTWHAHEDGIARRWPGEERQIAELDFSK